MTLSVFHYGRGGETSAHSVAPFLVLCGSLALLFFPLRAHAQALGGIVGTVTDQSGAIVPGANVTVTNIGTNVVHTATTSAAGTYEITDLNPGTYTVKIEKEGFRAFIQDAVNVDVGTRATANALLQTGSVSSTVEVTAPAITLQTTQPQLGTTIENKMVQELPDEIGGVNGGVGARGRQIDDFLFLAPGVTGGEFSHRINGGIDFQNEVTFNGVPVVQSETQGFQSNINPPFEMVNQFRVLTAQFSAQYGLAQGVAAYQFASGTNKLHGDAFELLRNNFFDARGAVSPSVPVDREHNFGFSVGGPVYLPRLYNGKDKTFFHLSAEWYRLNAAVTSLITVPTAAMVGGDFGAFPQPIFVPTTFIAPSGCTLTPGQQITVIPTACFSTISKTLLPLIPAPSPDLATLNGQPNFIGNLHSQLSNLPTRQTSWGFSIDHNFTQRQALHVSFWRDSENTPAEDNGAPFSNGLSDLKNEPRLGTGVFVTYSNAISNNLVVTGGVGWMGEINNEINAHLGVSFPGVTNSVILPTINFGGGDPFAPTSWGVNGSGETVSNNRKLGVSIDNNWLYTHGRHTFNFGVDIRRSYQDDNECQNCGGGFAFSSLTTSNGDTNSNDPLNENNTGSSFASFLLGQADSANRQFATENKLRNFYVAPYLQDDIKITPRFTLNAGLRWDILRPFTNATPNNIAFFNPLTPNPAAIDPATGQPRLGAADLLGTCTVCVGFNRASIRWRNFSPRLGFAYELNNKTVVLAGYSLGFLDGGAYEYGNNKVSNNYGQLLTGNFTANSNGTNVPGYGEWDSNPMPDPPATPFSPSIANGTGNLHAFSQNDGNTPYVQTWDVGVQREMPGNTFLSVSYIGNRGVHLPANLEPFDQVNPMFLTLGSLLGQAWTNPAAQTELQSLGFGQAAVTCPSGASGNFFTPYVNFLCDFGSGTTLNRALRPYPQLAGITNNFDLSGSTFYNALQLQYQKRFLAGLTYLVSYTLSRTMSNTDSGFSTFNGGPLNKFNQADQWAVADNDQTHVISISGVYELPIGPGKRFLHHSGLMARELLGGWQLSGVFGYGSGTPFGVGANGSPLFSGNRASVVSGAPINLNYNNYYKGSPVINTGAFSDPGRFVLGNAPRNVSALRNPWSQNESFALAKHFNFGEHVTAEVRMEYFNILNRMQVCGLGNTNVSSSNFGIINGPCQGNLPRQGQAYFKLSF